MGQHTRKEVDNYSRIVNKQEITKNDFNISPNRYIHTGAGEEFRPLAEIVDELETLGNEAAAVDAALNKVIKRLAG